MTKIIHSDGKKEFDEKSLDILPVKLTDFSKPKKENNKIEKSNENIQLLEIARKDAENIKQQAYKEGWDAGLKNGEDEKKKELDELIGKINLICSVLKLFYFH